MLPLNAFSLSLSIAVTYGVSEDCPNMINLALGLGIESKQPLIWAQLQVDCCYVSGIECTNLLVTTIDWSGMSLNGTINGTALPTGLQSLYLNSNQLTGNIPSILPDVLTVLSIQQNGITGYIPSSLPASLHQLCLEDNLMTGDVPSLPTSLQYLRLGWPGYPRNRFTGSVILNKPIWIYLNHNGITNLIVNDSSILTNCELSNNPLLGNPNVVALTMCTKTNLYSPSLLARTSSLIVQHVVTFPSKITKTTLYSNLIRSISTSVITLETNTTIAAVNFQISASRFVRSLRTVIFNITTTEANPHSHREVILKFEIMTVLRVCISIFVLGFVVAKSPFQREIEAAIKNKVSAHKVTEY